MKAQLIAQRAAMHGAQIAPQASPAPPASVATIYVQPTFGALWNSLLDRYEARFSYRLACLAIACGIGAAIGSNRVRVEYVDRIRTEFVRDTIEVCRYPGKMLTIPNAKPTP